ncbi:hypothetical protein MCAP1_001116 [Malassezia caprae]|uniref:Condensin complex subunit 2 n=1 Tax=Malassezia caprae TaxID=1381934 RepID=A0AAF0E7F4_9BASI|nr:hypothetical protein MCAP1_001116 [Malassezia caprae]
MLPFRAPSGGAAGARHDAADKKLGEKRVPSGASMGGRRIVSQGLARAHQRSEATGGPAAPPAVQVDNTSFEEWMKMATDNKINATNTWSFALIDYFHDMSLLRSDSGDGSINFQKASCTLDGCVKVWTSRVDSVMVETGRLLSGLQDDTAAAVGDVSVDANSSRVDEADDSDDQATRTALTKRRQRAREPTLAKSFAQLQVKRFDLEFSVDPLFKKTSADFDEGGAGGLLMNHLHVDEHMKVVFDASDVTGHTDGADAPPAEGADDEAGPDVSAAPAEDDAEAAIDLEKLQARLFSAAAQSDPSVTPDMPLSALLESRLLCPSTASFTFAEGNDAVLSTPSMEEPMDLDASFDAGEALDMDGLDFFEGAVPVDGDEQRYDVAVVPTDEASHDAGTDDHERLFQYFDDHMQKTWAGPEHWKMSRLHMRADSATPAPMESDERPKARRPKEAQVVDFLSSTPAPSAKDLFAPSATPSSILLSKAAQASKDSHLLPEDQHFNSKRLLRLFLKPKATILLRQRRAPAAQESAWDTDDVDGLWMGAGDVDALPADDGAFRTDLFEDHDVYDDVLPVAPEPMDAGGEVDMDSDMDEELLTSEAVRRVRPEFVDHARRAKQVDVKKLKDRIWETLALEQDAQSFDMVLSKLEGMYPPKKYEEISTSFCFICLLHLANEEELAIGVPTADDPTATASSGAFLAAAARAGRAVPLDDDDDARGGEADAYADEARVGDLGALQIRRDARVEAS